MRDFTEDEIMPSDKYPGFYFVCGEVLVIAYEHVDYGQMTTLVSEHGGRVVGFLEAANTYQLHFTDVATEAELIDLVQLFNDHAFVIIASLNRVSELEIYIPTRIMEAVSGLCPAHNPRYQPSPTPAPIRPDAARDRGMIIPNDTRWEYEWYQWFTGGPADGSNWGMEAINAPSAWYLLFDEYMNLHEHVEYVNVGVIDTHFAPNHEDLEITLFQNSMPISEVPCGRNLYPTTRSIRQGTMVAGIIGAGFNNGYGIAGGAPNSIMYGYSLHGAYAPRHTSTFRRKHALATLFANDVRLINSSMGNSNNPIPSIHSQALTFNINNHSILLRERNMLTVFLRKYLDQGVCFLIVESAGNASNRNGHRSVHVGYTTVFGNIRDPEIRNRIIVVGGMRGWIGHAFLTCSVDNEPFDPPRFHMLIGMGSTQVGRNVNGSLAIDIYAPGYRITSTSTPLVRLEDINLDAVSTYYHEASGNVMAAPHVTSVAAMIWGVRPDLSGVQVREYILQNPRHDVYISRRVFDDIQVSPILCAFQSVYAAINSNEL